MSSVFFGARLPLPGADRRPSARFTVRVFMRRFRRDL